MDTCVNHPDNIAVEACRECGEYICGLHERALCERHNVIVSSPNNAPIRAFVLIFGVALTFILMTGVSILLEFVSTVDNAETGDVVTVDGTAVTVTETVDLPDFSIFIWAFVVIAVIILSTIAYIMFRWSRDSAGDDLSFLGVSNDRKDTRTYYCQNCGQSNTMDDLECVKCGKSTEDERKLKK